MAKSLQVSLPIDHRLPGRKSRVRRALTIGGDLPFLDKFLLVREIQDVQHDIAACRYRTRECRPIMLDDFSQAGADSGEHLPQVQVGHHRVVNFQQKFARGPVRT